MKKLLLIPLLLFVLNCQNDKQTERLKSNLNFESELTQHFFVSPDSTISIIGENGTKITFKTEDLKGVLHGPNITDSLSINLIELTSKEDLLLANAQTISNGKWLISGGAFKIEITANGEILSLKEGKKINIEFPLSTKENGMQLFYGERDVNDNMNWNETKVNIQNEDYFTINYKDSTILSTRLTKRYGVDIYRDIILTDTLGYLPFKVIKSKIKNVVFDQDTIRVYQKYTDTYIEGDSLGDEAISYKLLSLTKQQSDSLIKKALNFNNENGLVTRSDIKKMNLQYKKQLIALKKFNQATNKIFKTVEVSKLGWINIDKFAPEEVKVNIKLLNNKKLDAIQTYIVDHRNNTILNVYGNEINIPINRSFYIVSFGIDEDTFYAYKRSVRFNKSGEHKIEFKKIDEAQIKSIFKLE